MTTRICRVCHKEYPAERKYWRSSHWCKPCYNRSRLAANAERNLRVSAERQTWKEKDDPLIEPARVQVPWRKQAHMEYSQPTFDGASSCDVCYSYDACREHVNHGRPVMCEPIFRSDILLEKAYMARKEKIT